VTAFALRFEGEIGRPARSMVSYAGRVPVLAMLDVVLALEHTVARALARRLDVSDEDLRLRMIANASIGVMRAAGRSYGLGNRARPLTELVSEGIDHLTPLFATL